MSKQRNARFWIYHTSIFDSGIYGPVKITLRPGESIEFHRYEPTDEGWSSTWVLYKHQGDHVMRDAEYDGSDCDGRYTQWQTDVCPLSDLASTPSRDGSVMLPKWQDVGGHQYDQYAEMAGY